MSQPRPRQRPPMSAPNNVTLGAIVAVVAVALGFFVLRDLDASGTTSGGGGGGNSSGSTTTTLDPSVTTTTVDLPIESFKIQVANNSGVAGSAGKITRELQQLGYVVQPALNVAPGTVKRARTGVFYLAGCESAARQVADTLGSDPEIGAMPSPVPLETGTLNDACVLILLGTDIAGKTLPGATSQAGSGAVSPTTG